MVVPVLSGPVIEQLIGHMAEVSSCDTHLASVSTADSEVSMADKHVKH